MSRACLLFGLIFLRHGVLVVFAPFFHGDDDGPHLLTKRTQRIFHPGGHFRIDGADNQAVGFQKKCVSSLF